MSTCTAFVGQTQIASGSLPDVAEKAKQYLDEFTPSQTILIFDDTNARLIDLDFRGSVAEIRGRVTQPPVEPPPPRTAGRPKLGVVGREVTLLPRQWDWLNRQPGGASVALRRLVDEARKGNQKEERIREAQEAAYRFMSALAGNEKGFEESARALFARDWDKFMREAASWPVSVWQYALKLAGPAFEE